MLYGLLGVDHADFCGGLGTLASRTPTSCVELVHLGQTTTLLGANRRSIARVSRLAKFGSIGCFQRIFGGRFGIDPDGCYGRNKGRSMRRRRRWRGEVEAVHWVGVCLRTFNVFFGVNTFAVKNNCTVIPLVRGRVMAGQG